ncbi:Lipid droplet-associated hydrolase [Lachnellula suecica]|uniref:Lipid droplet-associated hydrolase n=1 Tax=Lachnellula suecica TaxID=602035 RepID=A0A8T9C0R4_9HELO|nr:Lipid droplet-associated hydrolase [Lachnellula suecica]
MSSHTSTSHISFHPTSDNPSASHCLIYFITGNPGLLGYYDIFLKTLNDLLSGTNQFSSSSNIFHIYGQSLAGFEDVESEPIPASPYSLESQIQRSQKSLEGLRIPSGPRHDQHYDSIILIGHSVGSYMLLEIIQRLRKSSSPLKIRSGILLFPTVTHIAQSPSGVRISALFRIPDFPRKASIAAKGLVWLAPRRVLKWLVGLVTRMPHDAVDVTTRFLRSRMGIWQALHMAKEEMETITEDRWDEDIWGIEHTDIDVKAEIPKLIFYFGDNDHWVANHTRDALIAARGQSDCDNGSSKPIMLIDKGGVDHGFCIRHSESIAEKVKVWIDDMMFNS